ncbi:uncharacterized protein LOC131193679 isoform X2 [Ahaetulla prasina]|uniref:uncharacterized protein LOC131193679 isoform X2 n=1 Tax=Ahaetulla prasina TaxID=499056 RepID=UPI0026475789|nr:uncharacterized protein LOC131193679 isoform X2 [Ahaetulla prasina]
MLERTKRGKLKRKRLAKTYIGSPSNFKHLCHIGWSPQTDFVTNIEPELKMIFTQAGITQDHLKDKRTSKKIFETIENQGGIQTVSKDTKESRGLDCNEDLPSVLLAQLPCMSPSKKTSHHNLIQSLKQEHLKRAHSDYHLTPVAENQLSKEEGIVAALKDVIQKRHTAIPASGNEEFQSDLEYDDEWDD